MKIRQALKFYNKSKPTLFKIRNINDAGFILDKHNIAFNQCFIFKGMRYTEYRNFRGIKHKRHRQYCPTYNEKAFTRIKKYLNNTSKVRFYRIRKMDFEITIVDTPNFKNNLPKINSECYAYDDGKVRKSREYTVYITNIIPFKDTSEEVLNMWKEESDELYWIFSNETDYFIEATYEGKTIYFARMISTGDWFSIHEDLLLDSTGEFHESLIRNE